NVPFEVLSDFLHCPGGPQKAQCFTTSGLSFQTASAADASFNVQQLLKSCYARDSKQIARVSFSGLPKPQGTAVSLTVKTKLPAAQASPRAARTIGRDATTAAKWFRYENVKVSVVAGGSVQRC